MHLRGWIGSSRRIAPRYSRAMREQVVSQSVTDLTESASLCRSQQRGRFTDKGTPGVILGRKAKVFAILDFRFAIFDWRFWTESVCASIRNQK